MSRSPFALLLLLTGVFVLGPCVSRAVAQENAAARWYKGNTHTHSLWSDGNDFPDMIVDWYHKRDYHFLALSDHNVLSRGERWMDVDSVIKRAGGNRDIMDKYLARFGEKWVEQRDKNGKKQVRLKALADFRPKFEKKGKFLLIEGEEITDGYKGKPVHINAINLQKLIPPQKGKSVRDVIRRNLQAVQAQEKKTGKPILDHLNHPNFRWGVTAEDLAYVLEERYFEVYNGHPGVRQLGDKDHASVELLWDIANVIRIAKLNAPPLYAVATDDSHTYHGRKNVSPGRGWVMVRSTELSADALIYAMRRGDFYASSGVTLKQLNYDAKKKVISIEIQPDGNATFTTKFIGTLKDYDRTSSPVLGKDGKPINATHRYSKDVGKVLAEVKGLTAKYKLTGKELYVRAIITSSKAHDNPSIKGQRKQAWTQPVGWIGNIDPESKGANKK